VGAFRRLPISMDRLYNVVLRLLGDGGKPRRPAGDASARGAASAASRVVRWSSRGSTGSPLTSQPRARAAPAAPPERARG
jgi:hypothetical protein